MVDINTSMNYLKSAIFREIRKDNSEFQNQTDEDLNKILFYHPNGLRLSLTGFIAVKKVFTAYSFEMPDTLKSRHKFGLSKMAYPYFFTKRRLILFSEVDAMVIKIQGGIEGFLETCSQID